MIAIDDFGTGYASLSYLRRFPVDVLKIDRSFVEGLGGDPQSTALVAAVINLAHTLELTAIAEGVETAEQHAKLRSFGCDAAQGYYLGAPQDAEETGKLLKGFDDRPLRAPRIRSAPRPPVALPITVGSRNGASR